MLGFLGKRVSDADMDSTCAVVSGGVEEEAIAKLQKSVPAFSAKGTSNSRPEPPIDDSNSSLKQQLNDRDIEALVRKEMQVFFLCGMDCIAYMADSLCWIIGNPLDEDRELNGKTLSELDNETRDPASHDGSDDDKTAGEDHDSAQEEKVVVLLEEENSIRAFSDANNSRRELPIDDSTSVLKQQKTDHDIEALAQKEMEILSLCGNDCITSIADGICLIIGNPLEEKRESSGKTLTELDNDTRDPAIHEKSGGDKTAGKDHDSRDQQETAVVLLEDEKSIRSFSDASLAADITTEPSKVWDPYHDENKDHLGGGEKCKCAFPTCSVM